MTRVLLAALVCALSAAVGMRAEEKPVEIELDGKKVALNTEKDKASFALAQGMGTQLADIRTDLNSTVLIKPIKDAVAGTQPKLSSDDRRTWMKKLFEILKAKKTPNAPAPAALTQADKDNLAQAIGESIGQNLQFLADDLNMDLFYSTFSASLGGAKFTVGFDEQAVQRSYLEKCSPKMMERMGASNKKLGEAYLAENKAKAGVVTLDSGLQYKVLTDAKGDKPKDTDTVSVHYEGRLIDGSVFDSSIERGQPATFPVNGVIPGWIEALKLMSVGAKWQLVIPSNLAYGPGGRPGIPPNAVLVFQVELMGIEKTPPAPPKVEPK